MVIRRMSAIGIMTAMLLTSCASEDDNAACSIELDQEQHAVAERVVSEFNDKLGTIRFSLEDGMSPRNRRDVAAAVQDLQEATDDLDRVFSQGCL